MSGRLGVGTLAGIGSAAFKFALAFSLVSTFLALALATAGVPVPDILKHSPINPQDIVKAVNNYADRPVLMFLLGAGGVITFAILNIVMGIAFGFPKLVVTLFSAVAPELLPLAAFIGAFVEVCIIVYMVISLVG